MKKLKQVISHVLSTRLGFILTLLLLYWLKTMWAYHIDFTLDLGNFYQVILSILNPIPFGLFLLGLSLYIKRTPNLLYCELDYLHDFKYPTHF